MFASTKDLALEYSSYTALTKLVSQIDKQFGDILFAWGNAERAASDGSHSSQVLSDAAYEPRLLT